MSDISPILGFKTFTTEDEFVAWQLNKPRTLFQVMPIVMTMSGNADQSGSVQATTVIGCFCTYKIGEA